MKKTIYLAVIYGITIGISACSQATDVSNDDSSEANLSTSSSATEGLSTNSSDSDLSSNGNGSVSSDNESSNSKESESSLDKWVPVLLSSEESTDPDYSDTDPIIALLKDGNEEVSKDISNEHDKGLWNLRYGNIDQYIGDYSANLVVDETDCTDEDGGTSTDGGSCLKMDLNIERNGGIPEGAFPAHLYYSFGESEGETESRVPQLENVSDLHGKRLLFDIRATDNVFIEMKWNYWEGMHAGIKYHNSHETEGISYVKYDLEAFGFIPDGTWQSITIEYYTDIHPLAFKSMRYPFSIVTWNLTDIIYLDNIRYQ
ncbi:MAG: hypothetical protein OCD76_02390 [Reichenbachiella sp.]